MGNIFTGSEIVEIGIQIEKNGRDFYTALVKRSKSSEAKGVFKFLAIEEQRHIAVFQKILDSVEKYEPTESYPGEYFSYMNSLASRYIFTKKDQGGQIAQNTENDKEAVNLGIGFEKDSITFYEGMKKAVPKIHHKVVDELIAQEQRHLRELSRLKKILD